MDTTNVTRGAIVVGVDGSDSAARALTWAVDQAVVEGRPLVLAHAASPADTTWLDPMASSYQVATDELRAHGHELLRAARVAAEGRQPGLEVHTTLRLVDARHLLFTLSEDAAMVVLGSHGRGPVRSLLLGSVGVALSRRLRCPLVIHRPGNEGRVRHGVLVGDDGTCDSREVLEFAFRQASLRDLPLTVQHSVWDSEAADAGPRRLAAGSPGLDEQRLAVAESVSGFGERYPDVRVEVTLARGHAADCLVLAADRMDLLVVGRHEAGPLTRITRGSVATTVVEHAACPVAVVPVASEA